MAHFGLGGVERLAGEAIVLGTVAGALNNNNNQGAGQVAPPVDPAWQPLVAEDAVAFVAPSHAEQKAYYGALADTMRQWGLQPVQQQDLVMDSGYFAWPNTPERRADHIISALQDPNIKVIVALEGGNGASEVVEMLKKRESELDALPKRAIPLIGYSDATQLHLFLGQKGLVSPVQGPSVEFLTERPGMDEEQKSIIAGNQQALQSFLMGTQEKQPDVALIPINYAAQVTPHIKGTLIGGADISIALSDQSSHRLATDGYSGQILFLEGRNSASLRHALTKLQDRQQLGNVDAIVLGRYYDNQQYTGDMAQAYTQEIQQTLQDLNITKPVYFGVPAGHPNQELHAAPVIPIPLYTPVEITSGPEIATMSMGRFRDKNESAHRRSQKPETPAAAVDITTLNGNESSSLIVVKVPANDLRLPDTSAAMASELGGKRVVLDFGDNASLPMMHMALMELQGAGKLSDAQSVLVAGSQPVQPETQAWLQDFQKRHLPGVPMQAVELKESKMLSALAGRSSQQTGLTPG